MQYDQKALLMRKRPTATAITTPTVTTTYGSFAELELQQSGLTFTCLLVRRTSCAYCCANHVCVPNRTSTYQYKVIREAAPCLLRKQLTHSYNLPARPRGVYCVLGELFAFFFTSGRLLQPCPTSIKIAPHLPDILLCTRVVGLQRIQRRIPKSISTSSIVQVTHVSPGVHTDLCQGPSG